MSDSPAKPAPPTLDDPWPFRFRIVHMVYIVTLLGAALATFGPGGIVLVVIIGVFWALVFTSNDRPRAFVSAFIVMVLCACLISRLLPAVTTPRGTGRRMQCSNNLKQIAIALHNYHDTYGCFPPAYFADANGKPMHSWRVLLLPFVEEAPLYNKYNFNEPWDGPNNGKLLDSMPSVYACPSAPRDEKGGRVCTSYLAVVGNGTVWPGSSAMKLSEIADGASDTVLVIEHDEQNVPWMAPADLTLDEALARMESGDPFASGNHRSEDFFYEYVGGRYVAFADGSVRYVSAGAGRKAWSAILGAGDGAFWREEDLDQPATPSRRLRIDNFARLAFFLLVMICPTPWVYLNPTSGAARESPKSRNTETLAGAKGK